jgi:hypothetical protein
MFNNKRIEQLEKELLELERRVAILENPPKFNVGDRVEIYDSFLTLPRKGGVQKGSVVETGYSMYLNNWTYRVLGDGMSKAEVYQPHDLKLVGDGDDK